MNIQIESTAFHLLLWLHKSQLLHHNIIQEIGFILFFFSFSFFSEIDLEWEKDSQSHISDSDMLGINGLD